MKRLVLIFILTLGFGFIGNTQINAHAIGLRGGAGNFGRGAEITYQHALGDWNRLELDLGYRGGIYNGDNYRNLSLSGIYHWVFNIDGGLNWYIGPGARVGIWNNQGASSNGGIAFAVGGQIGIEYDFNDLGAPIQLSIDSRPMFGFIGAGSGFGYGGALALRFTF